MDIFAIKIEGSYTSDFCVVRIIDSCGCFKTFKCRTELFDNDLFPEDYIEYYFVVPGDEEDDLIE